MSIGRIIKTVDSNNAATKKLHSEPESNMKIQLSTPDAGRRFSHKFKLIDSVTKTHFKELMRLTFAYQAGDRTGLVPTRNAEKFIELVEKIEKSNPARARASHAKTAEKAKSKSRSINKNHCEHGDLGSSGYAHGSTVRCPHCGQLAEVW